MSTITISFECQKYPFNKNIWSCKVGNHEVYAASKTELKTKVEEYVQAIAREPEVGVAVLDDQLRVCVEHGGNTTTYASPEDGVTDGVVNLRPTCFSNYSAKTLVEHAVEDMAQLAWKPNDYPFWIPHWMPESRVDSYKSWVKFQAEFNKLELPEGW
jgi:hypothetical protein